MTSTRAATGFQDVQRMLDARDARGHLLAIVPASHQLDLRKLRRAASRPDLRLATEHDRSSRPSVR